MKRNWWRVSCHLLANDSQEARYESDTSPVCVVVSRCRQEVNNHDDDDDDVKNSLLEEILGIAVL